MDGTPIKRVATKNTAYGKPGTAPDSMPQKSLSGILRTGWTEAAAGGFDGTRAHLIDPNQARSNTAAGSSVELPVGFHSSRAPLSGSASIRPNVLHAFSTSRITSASRAFRIPYRGIKTIHAGFNTGRKRR